MSPHSLHTHILTFRPLRPLGSERDLQELRSALCTARSRDHTPTGIEHRLCYRSPGESPAAHIPHDDPPVGPTRRAPGGSSRTPPSAERCPPCLPAGCAPCHPAGANAKFSPHMHMPATQFSDLG